MEDCADAGALAPFVLQLWTRGGWPETRGLAEARAHADTLLAAGHRAWLAREGGAAVGYAMTRDNGDHLFIRHFVIDEGARGRGLGRAFLERLSAAQGRPAIRLDVSLTDDAARSFWTAMGFAAAATSMRRPARETVPC